MKNVPALDKNFLPAYIAVKKHQQKAKHDFSIIVERESGYNYRYDLKITGDINEDYLVVERLVKTLVWLVGGYKVYVSGSSQIAKKLAEDYKKGGAREFDALFMEKVYEKPFEIIDTVKEKLPALRTQSIKAGGNMNGCRIGFDAGGSDRKVSAVIDGECVYSEEVVWNPKINSDPMYHYNEILAAFKTAASKMPRVDAIGISSAGIYVNNRVMAASLFLKVNEKDFNTHVKDMYINAAKEIGDVPISVANDGDVTALAGALELNDNKVLGIAMGTSEAAGYINSNGELNGYLSELAFVPCDFSPEGMVDEWSGDYGCGVKYFSQDSVIKLAGNAGISFDENMTPAQKLKKIQGLHESGDKTAERIFCDIGIYLGHTLPYYAMFYDIKHLLLLGRVMSGKGGDRIVEFANKVLKEEYPELKINISIPDEENRRVGQSVAAASLPTVSL